MIWYCWCKGSPQRSCQTQTVSVWDIQLVNGSERLPEVAVEVVCLTAVYHLQWQKMLLKLFSRIGYVMKIELVQGWSPEGLHLNLYVHFRIRIITNMSLGEVWWEPFENVVTDTNTVHQSAWHDQWCHLLQVKWEWNQIFPKCIRMSLVIVSNAVFSFVNNQKWFHTFYLQC